MTNKKFSDLLNEWLSMKSLSLEQPTYEDYKLLIRQISDFFGDILVENLTMEKIQEYYFYEKKRGASVGTIKHKHVIIKPALDYAVRRLRIIDTNPAQYIELPKKKKFIASTLTVDEVKFLLEKEKNNLIEFGIFCASIYGMRRSEIIGLKWSAIDFKNNVFIMNNTVIKRTINGIRKFIERPYGKNNASTRVYPIIPLFKDLLTRIEEQQSYLKEIDSNYNYNSRKNDYIYLNFEGNLISPDHVSTLFSKSLIKHKLPKVRFHDLRHSCATFMHRNKILAKDIQGWLGHASIHTTMNTYTHLDLESKFEVATKIEEIFNKELMTLKK